MSRRNYQLTELNGSMYDVLNSSVDWSASNLTYSAHDKHIKSFGIRIAYARGRGWSWVSESDLIDDIEELNGYQNSAFRRHHGIIRNLIRAYNKNYCATPTESIQPQIEFPTPPPNTPLQELLTLDMSITENEDEDTDALIPSPIPALNDAVIDFIMKLTETIELFNKTIKEQ